MSKFFILLSAIMLVLVLAVGGGVFWLTLPDMKQAKQEAAERVAESVADSVSGHIQSLQSTLDGMTQLPEVIRLLNSYNLHEAEKLQMHLKLVLPHARSIRILAKEVTEVDQSVVPHMGYADLEMVQATLQSPQQPVIQGSREHRHLALTSVIKSEGEVVGVILASLKYDFLAQFADTFTQTSGFLEIRQKKKVLAASGDEAIKSEAEAKININGSGWHVVFWPNLHTSSSMLTLLLALLSLSSLTVCLVFFMCYRKLAAYLRQDQSSVINAAKDLLNGKISGNYPVHLSEMRPVITNLVQYKRVVDQQGEEVNDDATDIDDGFFEDGLESSFLDINRGIELEEDEEVGIALPSMDEGDRPLEMPASFSTNGVEPQPFVDLSETDKVFKMYDVRGIAGQTLTSDLMVNIGKALGSEAEAIGAGTVVVGRDGRISSEEFVQSLIEGIISTGRNVLDIGLVPSPVLYFVTHHSEGRTGAIVTASHNPPEYNGVKLVVNGEALYGNKIKQLQQRIENADFIAGMTGAVEKNTMFANEYLGMLCEDIHMERPMKVVVDCANGAASELAPTLLKTIGCEVVELYCDVDGNFPNHHPDPSRPENMQDLIANVKEHQADIGFAFDGDGDRLGVVDSSGKIIWADRQLMLFAKNVLAEKPGSEIIFDVKCSRHLTDTVIKYGGRPLMWKTGHSLIKAKVRESGAVLAGEMSGHIIFNDRWFNFDDALYGACRMIEILSADSRASSDVFADFPDSICTPEINVTIQEGQGPRIVEQMFSQANFQDGNVLNIDGMRVEFDDGWGLVRPSNTTPSLVLRFEADTEDALIRIQAQFKQLMLQIEPGLELSF